MLWPLLVTVAGFLLAFAPVVMKLPDLPSGLPEVVIAAGALWAGVIWFRRREQEGTRLRAALAAVLLVAAAAHLAWFFSLSTYRAAETAPAVGAPAPAIKAVRVRDGATFHLAAQRGRAVLLVFFRGPW